MNAYVATQNKMENFTATGTTWLPIYRVFSVPRRIQQNACNSSPSTRLGEKRGGVCRILEGWKNQPWGVGIRGKRIINIRRNRRAWKAPEFCGAAHLRVRNGRNGSYYITGFK